MQKIIILIVFLFVIKNTNAQYADSSAYNISDWTDSIFYNKDVYVITDYSLSIREGFGFDTQGLPQYDEFRMPSALNQKIMQKIDLYCIPYQINRKIYIPNTVKSLRYNIPFSHVKLMGLPNSLWYFKIDSEMKDSVELPEKYKKEHEFLGWYNCYPEEDWSEDVKYYKYTTGGCYKAAFKYLKDDYYTLEDEDCIFCNNKIYENFYFGAGKIKIPESFKGESILYIGDGTFRRKNIEEVQLPKSILVIGERAFEDNKLKEIDIPKTVIKIGKRAFAGNKLEEIFIPKNVVKIGDGAFKGNLLKSIEIPTKLDSLNATVFANNEIDSIVIPPNIKYIGNGAFANNHLVSVKFNSNIVFIGYKAFTKNNFTEESIPKLPLPIVKTKSFLYWKSYRLGKYNRETKSLEIIQVGQCQPGEKMDLSLGYKAVFKEDSN